MCLKHYLHPKVCRLHNHRGLIHTRLILSTQPISNSDPRDEDQEGLLSIKLNQVKFSTSKDSYAQKHLQARTKRESLMKGNSKTSGAEL